MAIFLPAGNTRFTIVDVGDVGEVAAAIIVNPTKHINKSYELTNNEKLTFEEMATQLSDRLATKIIYESPNLFKFLYKKKRENTFYAHHGDDYVALFAKIPKRTAQ
jgi:uncharacterized protein YbjT (DUF2867 family)